MDFRWANREAPMLPGFAPYRRFNQSPSAHLEGLSGFQMGSENPQVWGSFVLQGWSPSTQSVPQPCSGSQETGDHRRLDSLSTRRRDDRESTSFSSLSNLPHLRDSEEDVRSIQICFRPPLRQQVPTNSFPEVHGSQNDSFYDLARRSNDFNRSQGGLRTCGGLRRTEEETRVPMAEPIVTLPSPPFRPEVLTVDLQQDVISVDRHLAEAGSSSCNLRRRLPHPGSL